MSNRMYSTLALSASLLLGTSTAFAARTINIGLDTTGTDRIIACEEIAGASNDVIHTTLETATTTLAADRTVNLDDAGDSTDTVVIYAGSSLNCDQAAGGVLVGFSYGGFKVIVNGGDFKDIMTGGTGGFAELNGGNDNDDLLLLADGRANGDAGPDRVRSNYATGAEELFGNAGADCLEQINEAVASQTFDCGTEVDSHDPPTNPPAGGVLSCFSSVGSCPVP